MKHFTGLIQGIAKILDKLAGICFFGVMLLIISNILLREIFNRPILGTYEIVGFLTAMGIGLALAHCALQDGHIAVGILMEKLSEKTQSLVAALIQGVSLIFWSGAVWYLIRFGQDMKVKGLVSPSAEIPVYPVIYLVAAGLLGLCLVLFLKLLVSCRKLFRLFPSFKPSLNKQPFSINKTRRVAK